MDKQLIQAEALSRAVKGDSFMNYQAIFEGFIQKGIAPELIKPRENVFTFNAWKALGRVVRKGEKGVRILSWVEMSKEKDGKTEVFKRPHSTTVFHISQTEELKK